jgi:hypothetical protein
VYITRGWFKTKIEVEEVVYYQNPKWKARTGEHLKQIVVRNATPKDIPDLLDLGLITEKEARYIR